ncbi:hypothetical protein [Nitrososphaera sp.]|uniref:hypothetical protein n=1 Tax=Nitrososphaera sp. TaxID=1971748 RepID=UPI002EDA19BA
MARKADAQTALLKEILVELRRLNANLERRATPPEMPPKESEHDESEDMDEFE